MVEVPKLTLVTFADTSFVTKEVISLPLLKKITDKAKPDWNIDIKYNVEKERYELLSDFIEDCFASSKFITSDTVAYLGTLGWFSVEVVEVI